MENNPPTQMAPVDYGDLHQRRDGWGTTHKTGGGTVRNTVYRDVRSDSTMLVVLTRMRE